MIEIVEMYEFELSTISKNRFISRFRCSLSIPLDGPIHPSLVFQKERLGSPNGSKAF